MCYLWHMWIEFNCSMYCFYSSHLCCCKSSLACNIWRKSKRNKNNITSQLLLNCFSIKGKNRCNEHRTWPYSSGIRCILKLQIKSPLLILNKYHFPRHTLDDAYKWTQTPLFCDMIYGYSPDTDKGCIPWSFTQVKFYTCWNCPKFNFFPSYAGKIIEVCFKMYNKKIKKSASTKDNTIQFIYLLEDAK